MTIKEYMDKKDCIIHKYTGIHLIPDWAKKQIVENWDENNERKFKKQLHALYRAYLTIKSPLISIYSCPHCFLYRNKFCSGCIYDKKGEFCGDESSIYNDVMEKIGELSIGVENLDYEMLMLIKSYIGNN